MRHVRPTGPPCVWLLWIAWLAMSAQTAWALPRALPGDAGPLAGRPIRSDRSSTAVSQYQFLEGELSPLERGLFADAADGRWDDHTLLQAALVASGVADVETLSRYEKQVARLVVELERSGVAAGSPESKARAVFEFMHERILRGGYELDCTDLAAALEQGRYNCVSASVLFHCLASRLGLKVRGLQAPGHAMSRLILPDGTLNVETTCPRWFRLTDRPEEQAELVERTLRLRAAEGTSPAELREVSDVELVGTIYYNRGVDLLGEKRFAEALAANAKALRLDPDSTTARGNLLATINNWAIDLGGAGRYAEAIDLLRRGIALDFRYETFRLNYVYLHSRWIEELCHRERFQEALDLIARAGPDRVDPPYFDRTRLDVYRRWARRYLAAGQTDQALAVFEEAKRAHGDLEAVLDAEVAELNQHASGLIRKGRLGEAVALLDQALARGPGSAVLEHNRRVAAMRWAESAFQGGDYAEAIRRTTYGATPGHLDEALANNVLYGYRRWISQLLAQGHRAQARRIAEKAMADPFLAGRIDGAISRLFAR
jgi:tetratricopeptide (TPR) repeat protein